MKKLFTLIFILLLHNNRAQLLFNGDFALGTLFWGCGAETNAETTYGGSTGNAVAEVDAVAGLCQSVSGLTIGKVYGLSFDASRRTGSCPSPLVTNVDITISGGALITTVVLTNTIFGWTHFGLLFIATSNSHNITFAGGTGFGGSTCGMIIDNIAVLTSALPIELVAFNGVAKSNGIELAWSTASENNNDHFEIERSKDGMNFETIKSVPSATEQGNTKLNTYVFTDVEPPYILNYYRLKQIDKDLSTSQSKIIAILFDPKRETVISLYPNPNNGIFDIVFSNPVAGSYVNVSIVGQLGKILYSRQYIMDGTMRVIKLDTQGALQQGNYHCVVSTKSNSRHFPLIIE